MIPHADPTVLLTTAGMQQFVPYFLDERPAPHTRLVSVQKCFRAVDIDEVGDPSHLTFFEMMGNFSIGDYFKAEVIPWALEFVTGHLGLDHERLWITIHQSDDEAGAIWKDSGIAPERIVALGDRHNWWGPPGASGPCGPDSELYYQQDPGHGCGFPDDPPDCDCGRLEFWNLVFMQYFQDEQGNRRPLPRRNVDTGIGLERTTALVQRTPSVYETDLFLPVIEAAASIANLRYGTDRQHDYALRVLADHGRGMTFLVADGVVPGTGGREYVLRRIVRRAIRYGRLLGVEGPFLGRILDAVVDRMAGHYPELQRDRSRIRQVLDNEEELFSRTLRAGSAQIERLVISARAQGAAAISGQDVFDVYQTFGFPPELTEEMLRDEGLAFDWQQYRTALKGEQERARSRTTFRHARHAGTNEFPDVPETDFLAWTDTSVQARVLALQLQGDAKSALSTGEEGRVVLEASPFYPEGGGQVSDTGRILTTGGVFVVEDTQFDGAGHVVHTGRVAEGVLEANALARGEVDVQRRGRSMRHHTATHLLHRALKDVLGEGTSQQGSLVSPEVARFDFNYPRPLTPEQLVEVASIVNDRTLQDLPVHWEILPIEQARQTGAVMMFGEKYGDEVRVVSIGDYSKELCGGTHTHHAGEVGPVVVANESGIGSGKRRIVAYAGHAALAHFGRRLEQLEAIAETAGAASVDDALGRVRALQDERDQLLRELEKLRARGAAELASDLMADAPVVDGVSVVTRLVEHADEETLKRLVDGIRDRLPSSVVVLGSVIDGKPRLVVGVTRDLSSGRMQAGRLLGEVARLAGGGGGGRPDFATGGGGDPTRLREALEQARRIVAEQLGAGSPA